MTNVHRYFRSMGDWSHSARSTVRQANLSYRFCLRGPDVIFAAEPFVDEVFGAPESIIALIVSCLFVPCSRICTIIWLFSLSSASVLFNAAYRFRISMGSGLVLSLRPLLTGDFRRFPILLQLPCRPPFLVPWQADSIASCCRSVVPMLLLLCY